MTPSVAALLKIDFATINYTKEGFFCKQKEQSGDGDRSHILRLVFVGRVLFMYLIEKLKMFFGRLLCANDHREFKVVSECSLILQKKDPCEKWWSLSLPSCCE